MWPTTRRRRRAVLPQFIELLAIIGFLFAAYYLTMWGWALTAPREVTVPKIVGLQQQEAIGLLRSLGLEHEVIAEKASEDKPEGGVLEAEPGPGRVVKAGRIVRLTISSGSRWSKVPDVHDMSVDRARALLREARLVVKREKARYDAKVPVGYVLGQSLPHGGKVPRGTEVELSVSKGPEPEIEVLQDLPEDSGTHSRAIDLTVPPGASLQEVKIIVTDTSGEHVAYREYHEPGDMISQTVSGDGPNAVIRVYLSGLLVQEKALNPKR